MVIRTRHFDEANDKGFIIESMPKSLYYDSHKGPPNKAWFADYFQYINELLKRAQIDVAVDESDPKFIIGYSIIDYEIPDGRLEYVFIKEPYRRQGIAKLLLKQHPYKLINQSNLTKLGRQILEQMKAKESDQDETQPAQPQPKEPKLENKIDSLIRSGFPVNKVTFQSAIISGFNTAESQMDLASSNKSRRPDRMFYTSAGIIIEQNKFQWIEPLANIIQAWITRAPV